MHQWEQVIFAIVLAAFGWLLFVANKHVEGSAAPSASASGSVAPWFLSYNSSAGLTGPVIQTGVITGGYAAPNLSIGQENSNVDMLGGPYQFPRWIQT